jgi:hypothetical protein
MKEPVITRLMALFEGFASMHGTHGTPDLDPNGLKWSIKRTASTVKVPVSQDLWVRHLAGKYPLGVAPIRENDTCSWGCIDVDQYDLDLLAVIVKIEAMKLPLVPCRSKSGGLHLFLFLCEPTDASRVQAVLRDVAAAIGFAGSEIFPKQTHVDVMRGDQPNWMVMPYFGGDFGGKLQMQCGVKRTGAEQTLEEFVRHAEKSRVSEKDLSLIRVKKPKKERAPFSDGPPCLQHMAEGGFPEGGRNNALFQVGVYLKRAFPSEWQVMLEQDNQKYMRPPLPSEEVLSVVRSLEKKDYEYKCKDQPMMSHCDSMTCRGRKHGVGTGGAYPEITGLRKLQTEPAVWFVDIAGRTISMETSELQNYVKFHAACMEYADTCFKMLPPAMWMAILNDAMANMTTLPAAPDIGVAGVFLEIMESFLTNRLRGERIEDILRGAPWHDEDNRRHYFRLADFRKFLEREGARDAKGKSMGRAEVTRRIESLGGGHLFKVIKDKGVNLWWVPSDAVVAEPELDAPQVMREVI